MWVGASVYDNLRHTTTRWKQIGPSFRADVRWMSSNSPPSGLASARMDVGKGTSVL